MKQLYTPKKEPMRVACFMSGTGTNVRKIIERQQKLGEKSPFRVVAMFTNNKNSNAAKIAAEHNIQFLCNDIKDYYAVRNAKLSDLGVRKIYDAETRMFLQKNRVDTVALCGYMSIITGEIVDNFLTINVHPADLRKKNKDGKRMYAGMQGIPPVMAAIMNGDRELRSTVHLVTSGLDEGSILLVSRPVKVKVREQEKKDNELLKLAAERNMETLKEKGDWVIFPEVLKMLARGRFSIDEKGNVYLDRKPIPE